MRSLTGSCLLAFACGVCALQMQAALPAHPLLVVVIGVALIVAGVGRVQHRQLRGALCIVACATVGFGYAAWRAQTRLADELPRAWEGVDVEVVGVVDDLPAITPRGTRFALAVERVRPSDARVPSRLSLAWFAPPEGRDRDDDDDDAAPPVVRAGERWQLTVRLKRPHGSVNPGGFDLEAWLLQQGLRATGTVRDARGNARLDAFAARPRDYVQRAREAVRARIQAALGDAPYAGVIVALAIGDQRAIPDGELH